MNRKPVGADAYDEKWIASAWGERANEAFLRQEIDHPRPRVMRAMDLAAIEAGQTVLDIACGRGEVPALAAEKARLPSASIFRGFAGVCHRCQGFSPYTVWFGSHGIGARRCLLSPFR